MIKTSHLPAICRGLIVVSLAMASCTEEKEPTANSILGIPEDEDATEAPIIVEPTIVLPNASVSLKEDNGHAYIAIDLTGVWDESASSWLTLYGTADKAKQNVWVTVDNQPKGIDVYNVSENNDRTLLADVVFLVDNSGSMSEEANAVAESIINWSTTLNEAGLDLRVGCVGYGDSRHAIDGALNLTTPELMSEYLNRYSGTGRTHYYGGPDAQELESEAEGGSYENDWYHECGMVALRFAHDHFSFRGGANRVYVNFTDEPNQPYGVDDWSVEYLNPENKNWKSNYGTVHTVFSENERYYDGDWRELYWEKPWLMSEYTGGSYIFVNNYATDWDLTTLPVTGAMQNTSLIRFANIDKLRDGLAHEIRITIQSVDEAVRAEKIIYYNFSTGAEE